MNNMNMTGRFSYGSDIYSGAKKKKISGSQQASEPKFETEKHLDLNILKKSHKIYKHIPRKRFILIAHGFSGFRGRLISLNLKCNRARNSRPRAMHAHTKKNSVTSL